jgi:hypothetical protein
MSDDNFFLSVSVHSNFRSVLPQITYGNMALIFLSHFHEHNKNEIFAGYWDTYVECF